MDSVGTNKRIFKIFPSSGSHTILVFPHQTLWQYADVLANEGVECKLGMEKIASFDYYLALASMTTGPSGVVNILTVDIGYSTWRRSLLITGDGRRSSTHLLMLFMTARLGRYAEDNIILIVRSGKSETAVTNNKRLCSRLLQEQSILTIKQ